MPDGAPERAVLGSSGGWACWLRGQPCMNCRTGVPSLFIQIADRRPQTRARSSWPNAPRARPAVSGSASSATQELRGQGANGRCGPARGAEARCGRAGCPRAPRADGRSRPRARAPAQPLRTLGRGGATEPRDDLRGSRGRQEPPGRRVRRRGRRGRQLRPRSCGGDACPTATGSPTGRSPRSSRGSRTSVTPIRPRSPSNGSSGSVRDLITTDVATHPEKATAALAYSVGVEDPAFSFGAMEPREVSLKIHAAWRSLFSSLASRRSCRRRRSTTSTGPTRCSSTCSRSSPTASSGR